MDFVECRICGFSYRLLNCHITRVHNCTVQEYLERFPGSSLSAPSFSSDLSKSQNERFSKPEERQHLSNVSSAWWADKEAKGEKQKCLENSFHSEEARGKFRQMHENMTPEERELWCDRSFHSPEARKKAIEGMRIGLSKWWADMGEAQKKEELKKRFHNAESVRKMIITLGLRWRALPEEEKDRLIENSFGKSRVPSDCEFFLGLFLDNFFPGLWVYNGDVSLGKKIDGRTPDFLPTDGRNLVIEAHGTWYHPWTDEFEDIKFYRERGYTCLVVWEPDCYLWIGNESERLALIERVNNLLGIVSEAGEAANP